MSDVLTWEMVEKVIAQMASEPRIPPPYSMKATGAMLRGILPGYPLDDEKAYWVDIDGSHRIANVRGA